MNGRLAASSSTHGRHVGVAVGHRAKAEPRDFQACPAESNVVHHAVDCDIDQAGGHAQSIRMACERRAQR